MCGIVGMVQADDLEENGVLPALAADALTALQHRGTESAGLVGSDGADRQHLDIVKGHGLARDVFTEESLVSLRGSRVIIGHNRYSTAGRKRWTINCVQPFVVYTAIGTVAIAHNGELVDAKRKREEVLQEGVGLSTDTDSELIAQMVAKAIALNYKLVMTYDRVYAIRDPYGNRPLCVGSIYCPQAPEVPFAYCAASESCALPSGSKLNCEVQPGEIVEITRKGIRSVCQMKPQNPQAMCIFEYVYFARNDSIIEGQQVQTVREECGRILAQEAHVDADIVSNSGITYEPCLHRNSYVGRSFIQPSTAMRQSAIHKKFGVLRKNVEGRRIVLIDDSIVRGNTMRILVQMLLSSGAKEVHLRIASPPVKLPCFMGINIPTKEELLASRRNIEQITEYIGATSVAYLSEEGLRKAVQSGVERSKTFNVGHCMGCLTGNYPVPIEF
ncbi:unnamed protein product [Nippostrongylus brasiliensis]|uniref:Amidophosphoribosyltransferase n=1 Tax=Nippostrongylus brasiliensis TaxID=27835 RepID=A0A0N4YI21_NIPBR|nr:unnamed protein product [Nippostrongylus brasiliensis]